MKLTVDTNCPWTPVEALEMARRFRPHDLLWLEEPVWPPEDWAGLARVRAEGGIALAAGENTSNPIDFKHMFDAGAVTYAQPSVTKIGGMSALREVAMLAEAAGVTLVPHSPYFGPGLLATLHFLAAQPREPLVERIYATLEPDLFGGVDQREERHASAVPQGPGLGVGSGPRGDRALPDRVSAVAPSRIGVAISGGLTAPEIVECVRLAEDLGYESAWVAEGHGGDQFAILAACATATKRIRLGTAISSVFVRSVPTIAMAAATVDALSGGRFVLGLGSSHRVQVEGEHGLPTPSPSSRVRESVEAIRALLRDGEVTYRGETVRIDRFDLWFTPASPAPPHLSLRALPAHAGGLRRARRRPHPHLEHGGGARARRRARRHGSAARRPPAPRTWRSPRSSPA